MAPADDSPDERADAPTHGPADTPAPSKNPKLRKRTKTGCLTCRKRRIKCDEERPICKNCTKSKRHCEGYNQRVIFKSPLRNWPAAPGSLSEPLPYHSGVIPTARPEPQGPQPLYPGPQQPSALAYQFLPQQYGFPGKDSGQSAGPGSFENGSFFGNIPLGDQSSYNHGLQFRQQQLPGSTAQRISSIGQSSDGSQGIQSQPPWSHDAQFQPSPPSDQCVSSAMQMAQLRQYGNVEEQDAPVQPFQTAQFPTLPLNNRLGNSRSWFQDPELHQQADHDVLIWQKYMGGVRNDSLARGNQSGQTHPLYFNPREQPQIRQVTLDPSYASQARSNPSLLRGVPPDSLLQTSGFAEDHVSPTEMLQEAAIENEDDEYFDVTPEDDEMELISEDSIVVPNGQKQGFEMMMRLYRDNVNDLSVRSYNTMLYSGILDNYRAEQTANPLKNQATARVFAHFIHATGPTLSIYERNPRNSTAMFSAEAVHPSQQSLWTYTLPMMALNNQGLLHAMLALASLHIAKLQGASHTPSLKHYAYALKKVRMAVDHHRRRHHPTTVAATLLLGFYEIMTADHVKWSSHLLGARELFSELNFNEMTKAWRKRKAEADLALRKYPFDHESATMDQRLFSNHYSPLPNERIVGSLMGQIVRYDEFGSIEEDCSGGTQNRKDTGVVNTQHYEIYQDLWWWYSRHDAFQSVISGNRLLTDYEKWSKCPPRGPLGDQEALYGTHDHTVLLLGRIADFAARDRDRKIRAVAVNGGQWRPGPGFPTGPVQTGPTGIPSMVQRAPTNVHDQAKARNAFADHASNPAHAPPSMRRPSHDRPPYPRTTAEKQDPGAPSRPQPPADQGPSFYGMAPSNNRLQMPSHFTKGTAPHPTSPNLSREEIDLDEATQKARQEWNDIRNALLSFASQLGEQFQPLPHDVMEPLNTPFGLSIQYRSYDIGIVWAMYHMMHIILARCHPAMPPAAMVAAGVAAPQTRDVATLIGRICAGVVPMTHNLPLNPSLGAALIETCMPLFIAGIQYTDAQQRAWLVTRVKDIERRTGWASAGMIANGCQKVWEKAGQAGRGPPYVYPKEQGNPDERLAGRIEDNGGYKMPPTELTDRRFIHSNPITRVHWAFGLLSADEDVRPALQ